MLIKLWNCGKTCCGKTNREIRRVRDFTRISACYLLKGIMNCQFVIFLIVASFRVVLMKVRIQEMQLSGN